MLQASPLLPPTGGGLCRSIFIFTGEVVHWIGSASLHVGKPSRRRTNWRTNESYTIEEFDESCSRCLKLMPPKRAEQPERKREIA